MWRLLLISSLAFAQDGARIYTSQCAYCHGTQGEGGRGAPLNRSKLRHAPDDATLARVIRRGIPDTGMPSSALSEREVQLVSAHVRSLGRVAGTPVTGDPARGADLYREQNCAACHTIAGHGGALGPDLTGVGARRSAMHLRASLTDPASDITPGYFLIRAIPSSGSPIDGTRVNEDTFSLQLRDAQGRVHSLWKSALRSLDKQLGKSLMPAYRSLGATRLDDLVAYLASLEETP